jgi:hypothetical protein
MIKNFFAIVLFAGLFAFLYKRYWSRQPDALDQHLTEQANLQELGKIATNAQILAQPAVSQFGDLPLAGRIITPFNTGGDSWGPTQWMPTGPGGWSYILN